MAHPYETNIANYILHNFKDRGIEVYSQVKVGKSYIGKARKVDLLVVDEAGGKAFAIECKYQATPGTADEKVPYALLDMEALRMPGCIAYAGAGFSTGVLHLLESSELAARCEPKAEDLGGRRQTWELGQTLAMCFGWWDVLLAGRSPLEIQ